VNKITLGSSRRLYGKDVTPGPYNKTKHILVEVGSVKL